MSQVILKNAAIWLGIPTGSSKGTFDISGYANAVEMGNESALQDGTTFGCSTKKMVAGLLGAKAHADIFADYDAYDAQLQAANVGRVEPLIVAASHDGAAAGDVARFMQAVQMGAPLSGKVGDLAITKAEWAASQGTPLVRGRVFLAKASRGAGSGTSSVIQLGAVTATQKLYSALLVFDIGTATGIAVTVKSDDAGGFGSPTTRTTHTTHTANGCEWKQTDGAITDDYFRVDYTVSGGSATFAVLVGIR